MGKYDTTTAVKNQEVAALFGYLLLCNHQVHDFQNRVIREYFERKNLPYSFVRDVIFKKQDAIPEEASKSALRREEAVVKNEILFYLTVVSEIDGLTDMEEEQFFDALKPFYDAYEYDVIVSTATKKAQTERKRLKRSNSSKHTGKRANPNSTNNLFRITQKEYTAGIDQCRKIARADFKAVKPIAESIIDQGKTLFSNLDYQIRESASFHPEVLDALHSFSASIEENVIESAESYRREFLKKESAAEDFTIALIGRTKAGKSTLRTVLTGQGEENIGHGAQRTTRINDIYEWNYLRIIDTPGIDAGSDVSDEDQRIAEKVIGEADVICYIAASDGLPKNAREFAVNIAKRNKPVIVLVNYKSNLSSPARFRRHIENPRAWLQEDTANKIEGYFEPIRRMAEENGVSSLISCRAVFLYAELLSRKPEYQQYAKVLRDSSGVDEFLAQLKDAVVNKGNFLRSKTIIDDTTSVCLSWIRKTEELISPVKQMLSSLQNERETALRKLNKERDKLLKDANGILKRAYGTLATVDAGQFADDHYFEKGDLSSKWQSYCKSIGFSDNLQNKIGAAYRSFSNEVETIMKDLFEDMQFSMGNLRMTGYVKANNLSIPFRELFRFAGAGLGIAGTILLIAFETNPIGWVLTGVGIVVGFIANLFKSNAKRRQEAKEKLYDKIHNAVEKNADEQIPKAMTELREKSADCIAMVMQQYDNLLRGLSFTAEHADEMIAKMEQDVNALNELFAARILEYSGGQLSVNHVEREFGRRLDIFVNRADPENMPDLSRVSGLLNETIEIKEV